MSFVAFDVETASSVSGSICAIGLVRFCNSKVDKKIYSLVRPSESAGEFDYWNISVHGICREDVISAPTFLEIYDEIASFIDGNLLVAHNAVFDSRHFLAAMDYHIQESDYRFACTLALSRRILRLPNYKLPTVCKHLGIEFGSHHNALNDAVACGEIFCRLNEIV